jgi:hypothetical protein
MEVAISVRAARFIDGESPMAVTMDSSRELRGGGVKCGRKVDKKLGNVELTSGGGKTTVVASILALSV